MGRGCVFPYVDGRRVSGNEICQKVLFVSLPFMSDQSSGREKISCPKSDNNMRKNLTLMAEEGCIEV